MLMVLGQHAPIAAVQLSQMMDINPGTISVYVRRLEQRGLVERTRSNQDRRTWQLALTPDGTAAAEETHLGAAAYTQQFLSSLTDEEQATLHRLLLKAVHELGYDWI
jgi:DNA-binding MarR family transcriptional regulator